MTSKHLKPFQLLGQHEIFLTCLTEPGLQFDAENISEGNTVILRAFSPLCITYSWRADDLKNPVKLDLFVEWVASGQSSHDSFFR